MTALQTWMVVCTPSGYPDLTRLIMWVFHFFFVLVSVPIFSKTKCCVISFSTCSFDKLIILVWLLVNPELSQFTYSLCTYSTLIPIFSTFYRVTVYTHCSNRYFESFSVHHGRSPTFAMQPLTLTPHFLLALFSIFIGYKHSIACILLVVNTFLKLF